MEVLVRLVEGEANVAVQVLWRDADLNFLRAKEEPAERFLSRLGISCGKHVGGGDRKRGKKAKRARPSPGADADEGGQPTTVVAQPTGGIAVGLLDAQGARIAAASPVVDALQKASHVEIDGERLPVFVNRPALKKLEVFGKPLAGCPLVAALQCEFCEPSSFVLTWLRQANAGGDPSGRRLAEGRVILVPEEGVGENLTLRADLRDDGRQGPAKAVVRLGPIEAPPEGWPRRRLEAFGSKRSTSAIRVVCYNILAATYAKSSLAMRSMYPYCPAEALDFAFRQPMLGRELCRLDGDIVCLQECTYPTFRKFLRPIYEDTYHLRITLKASRVSEGCALLVRKEAFDVLEEQDFLFRRLLRCSPAFRPALREVVAKWPDFLEAILPHMTTVFQVCAFRHRASGEVLVVANTHLFYHPLARHIRLLQTMCLLHQVQELREKHRASDGALPRVILVGDLNCTPDTGAVQLLLTGEVGSEHPDWEMASQFSWGREDEEVGCDGPDGDDLAEGTCTSAPSMEADAGDEVSPLPKEQCTPGMGLSLKSPVGPMADVYAGGSLSFTNFVQDFSGTLDYILTAGALRTAGTLAGVTEEDLVPHVGLPSLVHPSDHLSLAADLELVAAG